VICDTSLGLATLSLSAKFELTIFTHYEDAKGDAQSGVTIGHYK